MSTLRRHRRANLQTKSLEKIVDFQWLFKAYHVWFAASVSTSTASPSLTEISYLTTHPWWSAQCLFHQQIRTVWKFGISPKLQISLIRLSTTDFLLRNLLNFQQPLIPGFLGGPPAFHIWQGEEVFTGAGWERCDEGDGLLVPDLCQKLWCSVIGYLGCVAWSKDVDRSFHSQLIGFQKSFDSEERFCWQKISRNQPVINHRQPWMIWLMMSSSRSPGGSDIFFWLTQLPTDPHQWGFIQKSNTKLHDTSTDCDPQTSKIEITIETNSRNSCNSFGSFLKNLCKIRRFLKLGDPKKSMGVHIERSFMTWILEWFKWAIPIPEPPGGSHRDGLLRRLCSSSYDVLNQREHYRSSTKESPKCGGRLRDDFHGGTSSWSFPWDFGVPLETSSIYRWDLSWSKPAIGYLDFSRTPHFEILWNDSPGGQSSQAAKTTSCFSGFFKHQDPAPKLHPWLQCISREN